MRLSYLIAAAALVAAPATAAPAPSTPTIVAAPMHTEGDTPTYPRLTKFPDAKAMGRVNAVLAAQEKKDRATKAGCYAQIREAKQKPDDDSYSETIDVTYLSPHFLGLNVVTSYYCAGPYPTNGAEVPLILDLSTGAAVDFGKLFKPGFLPVQGADEKTPPSALTRLYRASYRRDEKGSDDDCVQTIKDQDPFGLGAPIFRLDAKQGLVVEPDFPHVIAACADEMALSAADLAPWLTNPALLADIRATVKATPVRR